MNDSMFVEFDPNSQMPPYAQRMNQPSALPLRQLSYFNDQQPYTYAMVGDQGALPQAGVQISAQGNVYDCVKSSANGLPNTCDTVFWMAPCRPQDMGSKNGQQTNPYETGVWKQQRTIGSNISAAASAPYSGLYTGLVGYIEQITQQ